MKRIISFCLLLGLLLLSACGETVPAYEQPQNSAQPQSVAPSEQESVPAGPDISEDVTPQSYGKDTSLLRLTRGEYISEDRFYVAATQLLVYDLEKDIHTVCCDKAGCSHMDSSCAAYLNPEGNELRFAVRGSLVYCAAGKSDNKGNLLELELYTVDLESGLRRSYLEIPVREGQLVLLGDVLVYGNTLLVSYALGGEYSWETPVRKTQYILALDLTTGEQTVVMEREIDYFTAYDIWGMNEEYLILAYHHGGGMVSYGGYFGSDPYPIGYDYDEYARDMQRWVLLEYPIKENAMWSEQVAAHEAATELELFSYSSFYQGRLYYVANSYVKVYDLRTHRSDYLFYQPGIAHMICADGKLFYRTDAKEYYYYDMETGITCQYQKGSPGELFHIYAETDDSFIGYYQATNSDLSFGLVKEYILSKEDFYKENYEAAVPIPYH